MLFSVQSSRGLTLIEVLLATAVIGTVVTGLFGLFVLSMRGSQEAERRVAAIALANEKMEMIRNLPYADVGTVGGIPAGAIVPEEIVRRNSVNYLVKTEVRYIDDVYDGTGDGAGGMPIDELNADYKLARVEVSWAGQYQTRPVLLMTNVAPQGIEGGTSSGTLDLQVVSAAGEGVAEARVEIINDDIEPAVHVVTQTNMEGRVMMPGFPEAVEGYQVIVGKDGYTGEQTYDLTDEFIPDQEHTHLSMIVREVTKKLLFIDKAAEVAIRTVSEESVPIGNVAYYWRGEKTIGEEMLGDGSTRPVYKVDETGMTNSIGEVAWEALEWDTYHLTVPADSGYLIKEAYPLQPVKVDPGGQYDVEVVLVPYTDYSVQVTVVNIAGEPVDNATVRLEGNGFNEEQGTGIPGQVLFTDLPGVGSYNLTVTAGEYEEYAQLVEVGQNETMTVELTGQI